VLFKNIFLERVGDVSASLIDVAKFKRKQDQEKNIFLDAPLRFLSSPY
jgi:hypothetical protein